MTKLYLMLFEWEKKLGRNEGMRENMPETLPKGT